MEQQSQWNAPAAIKSEAHPKTPQGAAGRKKGRGKLAMAFSSPQRVSRPSSCRGKLCDGATRNDNVSFKARAAAGR